MGTLLKQRPESIWHTCDQFVADFRFPEEFCGAANRYDDDASCLARAVRRGLAALVLTYRLRQYPLRTTSCGQFLACFQTSLNERTCASQRQHRCGVLQGALIEIGAAAARPA